MMFIYEGILEVEMRVDIKAIYLEMVMVEAGRGGVVKTMTKAIINAELRSIGGLGGLRVCGPPKLDHKPVQPAFLCTNICAKEKNN